MKLYYSPGSCSLSVHIALREVGAAFEPVRVDLATHTLKDGADYRDISPRGYVPLLELDDGDRYTETPALLQYVAELDSTQRLIGGGNAKQRYTIIQWLAFISSELHKGFGPLWRKNTPEAVQTAAREKLNSRFKELNERLAHNDFLADEFSVADAYCFTVVNWANFVSLPLAPYPKLQAFLDRVHSRPPVRAALEAEGLA